MRLGDLYRYRDEDLLDLFDLNKIREDASVAPEERRRRLEVLAEMYGKPVRTYDTDDAIFEKVALFEFGLMREIQAKMNAANSAAYGRNITGQRFLDRRAKLVGDALLKEKMRIIREFLVKMERTQRVEKLAQPPAPTLVAIEKETPLPPPAPNSGGIGSLVRQPVTIPLAPTPAQQEPPVHPYTVSPPLVPAKISVGAPLQPIREGNSAGELLRGIIDDINRKIARGTPKKKFLGISYRNSATAKQYRDEISRNLDTLKREMVRRVDEIEPRNMNVSMKTIAAATRYAQNLGFPLLQGLKPGEIADGAILTRMGGRRRTLKRRRSNAKTRRVVPVRGGCGRHGSGFPARSA
jgi:hypothetical protein